MHAYINICVCKLCLSVKQPLVAQNVSECVYSLNHSALVSRCKKAVTLNEMKLLPLYWYVQQQYALTYATTTANICKTIYCAFAGVQLRRYVYAPLHTAHSYGGHTKRKLPQICNKCWKEKCCTECHTNLAYVQNAGTILYVTYTYTYTYICTSQTAQSYYLVRIFMAIALLYQFSLLCSNLHKEFRLPCAWLQALDCFVSVGNLFRILDFACEHVNVNKLVAWKNYGAPNFCLHLKFQLIGSFW